MKSYTILLMGWLWLFNGATCKNANTPYPLGGRFCKGDSCIILDTLSKNIQAELDGKVVKYAFVLRHGLASVAHAVGKKRATTDPPEQEFTADDRFNPASVTVFFCHTGFQYYKISVWCSSPPLPANPVIIYSICLFFPNFL